MMDRLFNFKYPITYVEWYDPTSLDEWWSIEGIKKKSNLIRSCGFLVKESKQSIILGLNWDFEEDRASCMMIIPKALIRSKLNVVSNPT